MYKNFQLYYRWWKTWKRFPVFSWVRASSLYRAGRYDLAIEQYQKGLKSNTDHPARQSARLDLAYCYFKVRRFKDALDILKTIINEDHLNRDAYLRTARIQSWMGHSLDAAWTMRRALQRLEPDPELVALFLLNVVEHDGTAYLVQEAFKYGEKLDPAYKDHPLLKTAYAKAQLYTGDRDQGRAQLLSICSQVNAPCDAFVLNAEILVKEGNIAEARHELKKAMSIIPDHPRVLSLSAETYLTSGPFYNNDYAKQLATLACQSSQWCSPRDLHILAEAYFHCGDKISALVIASKAKQAGSQILGTYRDFKNLEKLIETLSTGTQA
jgi:tetratricopeptide (TPR) repeat protein